MEKKVIPIRKETITVEVEQGKAFIDRNAKYVEQ